MKKRLREKTHEKQSRSPRVHPQLAVRIVNTIIHRKARKSIAVTLFYNYNLLRLLHLKARKLCYNEEFEYRSYKLLHLLQFSFANLCYAFLTR